MKKTLIILTVCLSSIFAQDKDSRCPANEDANKPTQFGHPTDCSKFFKCMNGRSYEITCPTAQHWNNEKNYCDTMVNAKCDSSATEAQVQDFQPFQQRPDPHQQQPIRRPNQQPPVRVPQPPQRPQQPNQPQRPQQPNQPQRPQQPNQPQRPQQPSPPQRPQQPIQRPAPGPQRPNMPQQPIAPPQRPWVPQPIAPPQRPSVQPPQQPPRRPQQPQQPQQLPQRPVNISEHPDFINCPSVDRPGQIVYFPYHMNCDMFYQCVGGRGVLLRCPHGMAWDLRNNRCDRAENVICATPRRPL